MADRYEAEELDDETLAYLQRAGRREGSGMPGIYFDAKEAKLWGPTLPILAAVCGPIVLLLTFLLGWGSTGDPPGTAMFLTAGILLGGWLIVAALRVLIARQRDTYLGHFTYVDPLYVWNATGTGVWVTSIDLLLGASCQHHSNESGFYKNSTVDISLADKTLTLTFNAENKAERLTEFLDEVSNDRAGEAAERGYAALEAIDYDEDDDDRRVSTIPRPEKVRSSLSWLPLVILPIVGLGVFFICLKLATAGRDDAIFDIVKNQQAAALRSYLIDSRNTRHRDEAKTKLRTLMEPVAQRVAGQGKELGAGLAEIVREVSGEARPGITICFPKQEKRPDTAANYLSSAVLETVNRDLVKEISDRLSQHLGQETADFAEVTEPPAMIEFVPKVVVGRAGEPTRIDWLVTLKANPEAKPLVLTISTQVVQPGDDPAPAVRALYRRFGSEFNARLTQQK